MVLTRALIGDQVADLTGELLGGYGCTPPSPAGSTPTRNRSTQPTSDSATSAAAVPQEHKPAPHEAAASTVASSIRRPHDNSELSNDGLAVADIDVISLLERPQAAISGRGNARVTFPNRTEAFPHAAAILTRRVSRRPDEGRGRGMENTREKTRPIWRWPAGRRSITDGLRAATQVFDAALCL
jgi:hypothetical protein